jgi:hypothetical protein
MTQRLGRAYIKVDGDMLESMPGAKVDVGGVSRSVVLGNNKVLGFAEKPKEAMVECEVAVGPATSLLKLAAIADATITFECDTGQTYVIKNAFLTEPPVATDGDGGKVPLKFAGDPAEEMGV